MNMDANLLIFVMNMDVSLLNCNDMDASLLNCNEY